MSFAESIIVPLSLFKACQLDKTINVKDNERISILYNDKLPPDKKMLLYNQQQIKSDKEPALPDNDDTLNNDITFDDILVHINERYRPQLKSILEAIANNKDIISYDKNYTLKINGKIIEDSNIIDILKYFTKNSIITKEDDIPNGAFILYDTLVNELNIPKSWIPMSLDKRRRSKRKRNQSNKKNSNNTTPTKKKTRQMSYSEQDYDQTGGWIIY